MAKALGAFGLDVTLIVCRPLPEDKGTDIDSEPQTKNGSRETRRKDPLLELGEDKSSYPLFPHPPHRLKRKLMRNSEGRRRSVRVTVLMVL